MVINFADKAVIGIAAVPMMQELQLGPRQFGLVGSSFFLLFAVSSVATGFLVNRVQTRWVLLAMGFHLGADPVSDDRLGRTRNPGGLSYRARGGRRSRNTGGAAFRLQVVPQRTAYPSDRRHCARRGDRRHGGAAVAQLGHCALDLALGLRLTRPGRPRLVRIVARLRPRRGRWTTGA
jgi:hypothetical protein